jgi:hypothetical protein
MGSAPSSPQYTSPFTLGQLLEAKGGYPYLWKLNLFKWIMINKDDDFVGMLRGGGGGGGGNQYEHFYHF